MDNVWSLVMTEKKKCEGEKYVHPGSDDIFFILYVSLALGGVSFIVFCIIRPRWKTLYSARKSRLDSRVNLPTLPDSFLGWIPGLYNVTEEQVLASAGLDAFVFLNFFKMAIRIFAIMAFFAAVVLTPINHRFLGQMELGKPHTDANSNAANALAQKFFWRIPEDATAISVSNGAAAAAVDPERDARVTMASEQTSNNIEATEQAILAPGSDAVGTSSDDATAWDEKDEGKKKKKKGEKEETGYLYAYLVFTYFFTALTVYILNNETFRVLRVRQDYLGTQSTITDRTFRLSGIPKDMKSEEKIKHLVEKLEIGLVESVTLCRDWGELDNLIALRDACLRKLEKAWAQHHRKLPKVRDGLDGLDGQDGQGEENGAAGENGGANERSYSRTSDEEARLLEQGAAGVDEEARPQIRVWYGFLHLQHRLTDAIDWYEEKLRRLDRKIVEARKKTYEPADLAFVTMDSIASCQMAIQALIDPRPGRLLTKPAPSPHDVVWRNTYAPRGIRRLKSWTITLFIGFLSAVWLIIVAFLASLLSTCTIEKAFPGVGEYLSHHDWIRLLVQTGLPTGAVSLLNIAVPFLYDFLSQHQGMISQGQIELSFVSKNFFFTFFNIFLVFAVSGSTTQFLPVLWGALDKTSEFPQLIAQSIMNIADFYISFIVLQGVGLLPFRLLEPGGISLYAWGRLTAKTPRDFAAMKEPPIFSYGYYLPSALLIFILCQVYSILQKGVLVLLAGLIYFILGYFIYKYQLLYAMDQPQHATGGAWPIISYRIVLGLFFFQITMGGVMALKKAYKAALFVVPLAFLTIWYGYYFRRRYEPLTKFISLRSIRAEIDVEDAAALDENFDTPRASQGLLRRGSTIDEEREKGWEFVNPSLKIPLQQPWIYKDPPPIMASSQLGEGSEPPSRVIPNIPSSESELSLGDTHIWRS